MMSKSPNSDRTLILLEDIQSKLELVVEGQTQLRTDLMSEITSRHEGLDGKIQILQLAVNHNAHEIQGLHGKFDRLADIVARHDRDIHELTTH